MFGGWAVILIQFLFALRVVNGVALPSPGASDTEALAARQAAATTSAATSGLSTVGASVKILTSSDGTQIYANAIGDSSKPALVFVHGLALSASVFDVLFLDPTLLSKFYLVAYDMRGHGRSGMPNTAAGHSSALYAADFAAVVKAFNLNKPLFCGWSLGATVAVDIVQNLGQNAISGVVYISALPFIGPIMNEVGTPLILGLLNGFFETNDTDLSLSTKITFANSVFNNPSSVPVEIKWNWLGSTFLQFPAITQLVLTRAQDPTAFFAAGAKGLPLLIITGTADQQVMGNVVVQQISPHFTNVSTHSVAGGSHALFYDNQSEFVNTLVPFASRVTSH